MTKQTKPRTDDRKINRVVDELTECGVTVRVTVWHGERTVFDLFLNGEQVGTATWTATPRGGRYTSGFVQDRHSGRQLRAKTFTDLKFFTHLLTI